jgi:cytochrome c
MNHQAFVRKIPGVISATLIIFFSSNTFAAVDVDAAKGLARQNSCFICHSTNKEKEGPSFAKVAEKYRGNANAEAKLIHHLTSGEKAKFPDGHLEDHKIINTKDMSEIKNLVNWILAQ